MKTYKIKFISEYFNRSLICMAATIIGLLSTVLWFSAPVLANSVENERVQLRNFAYKDCLGVNADLKIPNQNVKAYCECSADYLASSASEENLKDSRLQCKEKDNLSLLEIAILRFNQRERT